MSLRILPLGGLGEVGKNCLALEAHGSVLVVDCGVSFDREKLGADVIHPDFRALERLAGNVIGLAITHGHEDHIGAIPHFLKHYDVPIYLPKHALELLREREEEHEILQEARFTLMETRTRTQIGPFEIEPIRVTHSTVDCTSLAIRVDGMVVLHTGDFKIDHEPTDEQHFDEARFREIGDEGISLLFSDSTNVDVDGPTPSERSTKASLLEAVGSAPRAVIIGLFASNVHRLRIAFEVAMETDRKVVLLGRGMRTHASVARRTGHLPWPDSLILPESRVREADPKKLLFLATGSQGEVRAALGSLARDEHPVTKLEAGDRVVFSSRVIPGNELEVVALTDSLLRKGIEVLGRHYDRRLHVSGHAQREDQKTMLMLTRPRVFVPVHGTLHHLKKHAALAKEIGFEQSYVLENGDLAELAKIESSNADESERFALTILDRKPVPLGYASGSRRVDEAPRRTRRKLAENGVFFGTLDAQGRLRHLAQSGVFDEAREPRVMGDLATHVSNALGALRIDDENPRIRQEALLEAGRRAVRNFAKKRWGTRPEVELAVVEASSAHELNG